MTHCVGCGGVQITLGGVGKQGVPVGVGVGFGVSQGSQV